MICISQVFVSHTGLNWFFHGIQGSSQHVPIGMKLSGGRWPPFRIVMLLKSTKWWNNNLLASPGSFWIFRGDSCDDERNAERNSWKLKIIHDLSRKIINQTSILGILVNQTKGIAIGELINPNLIAHLPKSLIWVQARWNIHHVHFFWFDQQTLDYHSKITSVQGFITRLFF